MSERQVLMVVVGAVLIAALIVTGSFLYTRQFVLGGYCKQQQLGHTSTLWVKCR